MPVRWRRATEGAGLLSALNVNGRDWGQKYGRSGVRDERVRLHKADRGREEVIKQAGDKPDDYSTAAYAQCRRRPGTKHSATVSTR
ncbi:hypothetical protein EYF80_025506 [Liparis tanakae]|uniref:Uncharacterized protein n=1 Tax=Liparis tanakae TaxID=230148 RepID=A0A4Z2HG95_9TELE|nr:hypothetical protein EYF80_025506 [Liparis tanakae]